LKNFNRTVSLTLFILLLITMVGPMVSMANETTVNLGTAKSFAVLAGSTITNTGPTTVSGTAGGDIGLHPGTSFTGGASLTASGTVHLADAVAQQAKVDLATAYNDAAGRSTGETIAADLGGSTLTPGVYTSASSIDITGTLTLDGDGVYIFQAGSMLTTASASKIVLINGAQPCKVFWQVGSSATLGTGSVFVGHILAMESITATTGAEVQGQLLARNGAVTLDTNTIKNDVCSASYGSLIVTKDVQGPVDNMTLPDFEITVTGPNNFSDTQMIGAGDSYTFKDLTSGTYTVSEGEQSEEWSVNGTGEYDVKIGEMTEVTITNSYRPSDDDTSDDSTPVDSTPVDSAPIVVDSTPIDMIPVETDTVEVVAAAPQEAIPQTGQKTDYSMAIILGGLAAMFAVAGTYLSNKKKKLNV
jgi:LPXTG-motif cell wall-anchored protein